jgi:KUP system potassium uptake protein
MAKPAAHGDLRKLALGALGVVYGDIGTSPLYTLHECTSGEHGASPTPENILGVLSLIFWSLTMVVTVKYLLFIMRADNRGEGGILALLALVPEKLRESAKMRVGLIAMLVIAGAALLYGDGIITPAISVLSAIEGLEVATTELKPAIIPLSCVILIALFAIQSRGTGKIGAFFGPIMLVWFTTIGGLGLYHVTQNPSVLNGLSPAYAVGYFHRASWGGFPILGGVVLAVTGGEALYADMGHFGRRPIRVAWLFLVMPALVLCYFGQGALMLSGDKQALDNPFYAMVPKGTWTYALVALAAFATIIASQALISGAFSLTHQAIELGFFPRVTVKHTSSEAEGQLYVPEVNWGLAVACVALVLMFKESSKLAAAYGIAVSGTMAITSIVYFVVARRTWGWPLSRALALLLLFLSFDVPFFVANLFKFMEGGYIPIAIGAIVFAVMLNWRSGRKVLAEHFKEQSKPVDAFLSTLESDICARVPGTGVFLASIADGIPQVCVHHVRRIRVLHQHVVLLTLATEHVPSVPAAERLSVHDLGKGFHRVIGRYGFMETPNVPALLAEAKAKGLSDVDLADATYYLGRESFLATDKGRMGRWSEGLFDLLSRNAKGAASHFSIPPEQVIELGIQIDL